MWKKSATFAQKFILHREMAKKKSNKQKKLAKSIKLIILYTITLLPKKNANSSL